MSLSTWPSRRIGDCAKFLSGGTPKKSREDFWSGDIPWVSSGEMTREHLFDTELHISEAGAAAGSRIVPESTVLAVVRGMSLAKEFRVSITRREMAFNQDLKAFECFPGMSAQFFFYSLLARRDHIRELATEASHGTKKLETHVLADVEIKVPTIDIQDRIVSVISTYDDLIENNRWRMALLEEAARQLYREWFVRLRFPGHEHTRIIDGVPEGWKATSFGDLCDQIREILKPDVLDPDTAYIGLEHIPRRSIALSDWGTVQQVTSSKHRLLEGDVLFGKIRPYFHKVGIAFVEGVASSDAIVIRPRDPSYLAFVLMTASSDPFVAATSQTMREGSKMPRADWKQMQAYPTPLPPDGLLISFQDTVGSIIEQLKTFTFANQKLRIARDLLLPRLMSGEIAV